MPDVNYDYEDQSEWLGLEDDSNDDAAVADINSSLEVEATTEPVKDDRVVLKKLRGGKVTDKWGDTYAKNDETYEVSPEAADYLLNLTDGYGRPYFVTN